MAASIGIIGGADGPTAIFISGKTGANWFNLYGLILVLLLLLPNILYAIKADHRQNPCSCRFLNVLEQAGRQIDAGYSGDWMATGTKAQIKAAMEADPEFKRNWDETVGDRMIKLVFIGKDMNKDKIIADLDACLVEPRL